MCNPRKIAGAVAGIIATASGAVGVADVTCNPSLWAQAGLSQSIEERFKENPAIERKGDIKGCEIANLNPVGRYESTAYGLTIEITDVQKIENGVQVLARAWSESGTQIGFGREGTIETERFKIYNPPVLVPDPAGEIVRELPQDDGTVLRRALREDPAEALRQVIAHNVTLVGKTESTVIAGSVGNTTSTFYPNADPETTSVDGYAGRNVPGGEVWATIRAGAGTVNNSDDPNMRISIDGHNTDTDKWTLMQRMIILFDTSAIPDTDPINTATLSLVGTKSDNLSITPDINIYTSTPGSNTTVAGSDYSQIGTTAQSDTAITYANWNESAYNDFVLNATGRGNVSKTSISKFGARNANYDVAGVAPTWTGGVTASGFNVTTAEATGTTEDPKLVVDHGAAVAAPGQSVMWFD